MSQTTEIVSLCSLQRIAGLTDSKWGQILGYTRCGWLRAKRDCPSIGLNRVRPLIEAGARTSFIIFGKLPPLLATISPDDFGNNLRKKLTTQRPAA